MQQPVEIMKTIAMRALTILAAGALCACVHLVSDYDDQMDKGVTDLQKKNEVMLHKIETSLADPSKTYDAKDYDEFRAALNILLVRAKSWSKNEATTSALYEIG